MSVDVQVTLDDGMITVKGERKLQKADKTEKFHRVESFSGGFERWFSLPENLNADAITCESNDGILTVHIPKSEVSKQKPKQTRCNDRWETLAEIGPTAPLKPLLYIGHQQTCYCC
jgi:HSP20 family molecular chaperone IbpA